MSGTQYPPEAYVKFKKEIDAAFVNKPVERYKNTALLMQHALVRWTDPNISQVDKDQLKTMLLDWTKDDAAAAAAGAADRAVNQIDWNNALNSKLSNPTAPVPAQAQAQAQAQAPDPALADAATATTLFEAWEACNNHPAGVGHPKVVQLNDTDLEAALQTSASELRSINFVTFENNRSALEELKSPVNDKGTDPKNWWYVKGIEYVDGRRLIYSTMSAGWVVFATPDTAPILDPRFKSPTNLPPVHKEVPIKYILLARQGN